jgi:hypothetical protein
MRRLTAIFALVVAAATLASRHRGCDKPVPAWPGSVGLVC